ncbi:site-specific integrase [Amycolatopsis sp. Poz14]|uniref:tyrosine-type recombinase/integrase n=1 Tax=Amycolatopsis sp. Poz14 TaxID=1447705 RepID=UPI001EE886A1|nr:site-specific integrase [Amycolatopsis sp. Poz14]MCG3756318.1 site-specific integrase [Amycolatopsis sp. Poz14]
MAHIEDRWFRDKVDPETGEVVLNDKKKPVQERTADYGKGMRYKVRWVKPDKSEASRSFPDKKLGAAKEFKTKIENELYAGVYRDSSAGREKFRTYAAQVLKSRPLGESSLNTMTSQLDKYVFPFFGERSLDMCESSDLARKWLAWLNDDERKLSGTYQRQVFDLVLSIWDAAVVDEKMRSNPLKKATIPRPKATTKEVQVWPEKRVHALEEAVEDRFKPAVVIGAGLGLRPGEVLAFSPDNIDRKKMIYRCTRQLVMVKGVQKFKLPKGRKVREIPLGYGLLEKIDAYIEEYPPVAVTLPWGERDGQAYETVNLLMTKPSGVPYKNQSFHMGVWLPAFVAAGLAYVSDRDGMHALRHLFASLMLSRGVSIKELSAYLGHSSEAFTLRVYTHLMETSYERARAAIDSVFRPSADLASAA